MKPNARAAAEAGESAPVVDVGAQMMTDVLSNLGLDRLPERKGNETREADETHETPEEDEAKGKATEDTTDHTGATDGKDAAAESDDSKAEDGEDAAGESTDSTKDEKVEDDDEDDDEDEKNEDGKLPPKTQAAIDKRIGKEVGKRKALEDQLQSLGTRNDELQEEVSKLREETKGMTAGVAAAQGMHPLFMAENEADLDERAEKIMEFRQWARKHKDGVEASEDGKTPGWTAEQIAERLDELERERELVIPKVRETLRKRAAVDAEANEVYPELFDRKSAANQVRGEILRAMPILRRYPNMNLIIGDMMMGQHYRNELKKSRSANTQSGGAGAAQRKPAPKVPASPAGGGRKLPLKTTPKKETGLSAVRVAAAGGGREALIEELTGALT
jgi:hypothetical protein